MPCRTGSNYHRPVLYDRAKIFVQGGAGGNGVVSFRREAHVPRGGPDGGDGGRGADVVLVCDPSLRDLQTFKRKPHYKAARGGHGEGANRHGASPDALEVRVPPGTVVEDVEEHAALRLHAPGQRGVVARGGLGGRGNRHFTTSTRQAPRFAERGLPGEERWLELRLKLLADAGLVGLPERGQVLAARAHHARASRRSRTTRSPRSSPCSARSSATTASSWWRTSRV